MNNKYLKILISTFIVLMLVISINVTGLKKQTDEKYNELSNKLTVKVEKNFDKNTKDINSPEQDFSNINLEYDKIAAIPNQKSSYILNSPGFQPKFLDSYQACYPSNNNMENLKVNTKNNDYLSGEKINEQNKNIEKNSLSISNSDTISPPWDDFWHSHNTQGDDCTFCSLSSSSEADAYDGSGSVSIDRAQPGSNLGYAKFGFQGKWTCPSNGTWDVIFQITYNGLVSARNIPSLIGSSSMDIECKVVYEMETLSTKETILWQRDTWDESGSWAFGDTIGLIYNDAEFVGGTTYDFTVEFQISIDIEVTGFEKIQGDISLSSTSFDEAMFPTNPKPDLFVSEYMIWTSPSPGYFWPGDSVNLLGNVINLGVADAGPFTVKVYVDDLEVGSGDFPGLPALNYIPLIRENYQWPNDINWHKITWVADYDDDVDEIFENNSEASVWFRAREKSDMTVTKVWATDPNYNEVDEDIFPNDPVIVWANISNLGDTAGPFYITLFIDGEPIANEEVPGWGSHSYGYLRTSIFNWPDDEEHEFLWTVDTYDWLDELDEENNNMSRIIGPPSKKAELFIEEMWSEPSNNKFRKGSDVNTYAKIVNNGVGNAGPFNIGIKVDNSNTQRESIENGIPSGGNIELRVWFENGWPDNNCHTFKFIVDIDKDVDEDDENNNEGSIEVCPGPDLHCTDDEVVWTGVKVNKEVTGTFKVKNIGRSGTKLDWKVSSWPNNWGSDWTFDPKSGNDLTGEKTITVTFTAPSEKGETYEGKIKLENKEDSADFDYVYLDLSTEKSKSVTFRFSILSKFFDTHPFWYDIIQKLYKILVI